MRTVSNTPKRAVLSALAGPLAVLAAAMVAAPQALAAEPPALSEPVTLTVGHLKVAHLAPIALAIDKLADKNVRVEMVEFQRYADCRSALAGGSVDVATMGPPDVPIAVAQGIDSIVGLMGVGGWSAYPVVRNGVEISDWSDLAGKRVGIGPASTVWFQFVASATEAGFDYQSLEVVNVQGGGAAFNQALQRGDVDVTITWEPFDSIPVVEGYGHWATGIDYAQSKAVGAELGVIGANRASLDAKREAIRIFVWAYVQAQRELADDPEALAEAIQRYTGQPRAVADNIVSRNIRFNPVIDVEQIKLQAKTFHEFGVLQRDVSEELDRYFDTEIVRSVM